MFEYYAKVDELSKYDWGAYDGDTIDLAVDVGFRMISRQRIRLLGINTPELRGDNKQAGHEAKMVTRNWLQVRTEQFDGPFPFIIQTEKADAFGRYLANIRSRLDNETLTDHLLFLGYPPYRKKS